MLLRISGGMSTPTVSVRIDDAFSYACKAPCEIHMELIKSTKIQTLSTMGIKRLSYALHVSFTS